MGSGGNGKWGRYVREERIGVNDEVDEIVGKVLLGGGVVDVVERVGRVEDARLAEVEPHGVLAEGPVLVVRRPDGGAGVGLLGGRVVDDAARVGVDEPG